MSTEGFDVQGLTSEQVVTVQECLDETGIFPAMMVAMFRRQNDPLWQWIQSLREKPVAFYKSGR
jgi:hypothetical protein